MVGGGGGEKKQDEWDDKNNTSGDLINCISCLNIKVNENNDRDHIRALIFLVKLVHIA